MLDQLDFMGQVIASAPENDTRQQRIAALRMIREKAEAREAGEKHRGAKVVTSRFRTGSRSVKKRTLYNVNRSAFPVRLKPFATVESEPAPSPSAVPRMSGALPEAEKEPEPVQLGASAPRQVKPGSEFTASFVAYEKALEQEVRDLLIKLSPSAEPMLGIQECRWKQGTRVTVKLSARGLTIDPPEQEFIWQGGRSMLTLT